MQVPMHYRPGIDGILNSKEACRVNDQYSLYYLRISRFVVDQFVSRQHAAVSVDVIQGHISSGDRARRVETKLPERGDQHDGQVVLSKCHLYTCTRNKNDTRDEPHC